MNLFVSIKQKILEKSKELEKINFLIKELEEFELNFQKDNYFILGGCKKCLGNKKIKNSNGIFMICNCNSPKFSFKIESLLFESLLDKKKLIENQIFYLKLYEEIKKDDLVFTTSGKKNPIGTSGIVFFIKKHENFTTVGFKNDKNQIFWDYLNNLDKNYTSYIENYMPNPTVPF